MRRYLVVLLLLSAAACSSPTPTQAPTVDYDGFHQEGLGPFEASLDLRFDGAYTWLYRLETRSDGEAVEYRLHIEGVSTAQNPGDVRMVMEGDVARMRGPGTDDACIQFPSDLELGLSFLTPDELVDPDDIDESLERVGTEFVAGLEATRYLSQQERVGDWTELTVHLFLEEASGATLRYDLIASGEDPLFDAGEGSLSGGFVVRDLGEQTIEPVRGCEIDLPLPSDATRLMRLPGLVAFDSASSSDEIVAFYQDALPEAGWEAQGEPETGEDAILLSYRRSGETLEINVETKDQGVLVELLIGRE